MEFTGQAAWDQMRRKIASRVDGTQADDLFHSAFLRIIERSDRKILNDAAYLVRSAINEARDGFRRSQHPAAPRELEPDDLAIQDQQPLQDEMLIARQRLERVKAGVEQLPPRTREVFLMHRIDGLKYREIAERLDISASAVEKHIGKALQFLTDWAEGW